MMKRIFFILMSSLLTCFSIYGQPATISFEITAVKIKEKRPAITETVLDKDIEKINETFAQIRDTFASKGYSKEV